MPLKKNDQIIIILAVIVIIVAGIGIALYTSPSSEDIIKFPDISEEATYEVEWVTQTMSLSRISEFAGKRAAYEGTVSIPHGNLKSITFNMSWVDDKALLGIFGLDTLSLEVTAPDGTTQQDSAKSARSTRAGTVAVSYTNINPMPSTASFEAASYEEAQQMLRQAPYYSDKWTNKEFNIKVSVSVGEILGMLRPRDKGNDFTLDITYEVYHSKTTELVETSYSAEDEYKTLSEQPQGWGLIIPTGFFGRC